MYLNLFSGMLRKDFPHLSEQITVDERGEIRMK